ncbi:MAG TPA: hypothetical protein DCE42_09270 [Myxococcales bacterium]|nr:hypothetical protein [Deltaproteobacteria bacterium]MBU50327.1 hypothetical protein [Deltaproteobacteria bacterium]HAA54935.1 hypothetical protein [Myxococcales bacterium]
MFRENVAFHKASHDQHNLSILTLKVKCDLFSSALWCTRVRMSSDRLEVTPSCQNVIFRCEEGVTRFPIFFSLFGFVCSLVVGP